mmetsp:Transcript_28866/g.68405  ORF Transcript_28866/g.68405 Transcript_28866/m.68405 type:complete len:273 (+) Transcript_28866:1479-2297(+)
MEQPRLLWNNPASRHLESASRWPHRCLRASRWRRGLTPRLWRWAGARKEAMLSNTTAVQGKSMTRDSTAGRLTPTTPPSQPELSTLAASLCQAEDRQAAWGRERGRLPRPFTSRGCSTCTSEPHSHAPAPLSLPSSSPPPPAPQCLPPSSPPIFAASRRLEALLAVLSQARSFWRLACGCLSRGFFCGRALACGCSGSDKEHKPAWGSASAATTLCKLVCPCVPGCARVCLLVLQLEGNHIWSTLHFPPTQQDTCRTHGGHKQCASCILCSG